MLFGLAAINQASLPGSAPHLSHWITVLKGDARLVVTRIRPGPTRCRLPHRCRPQRQHRRARTRSMTAWWVAGAFDTNATAAARRRCRISAAATVSEATLSAPHRTRNGGISRTT